MTSWKCFWLKFERTKHSVTKNFQTLLDFKETSTYDELLIVDSYWNGMFM